jgi:hypothetical protein
MELTLTIRRSASGELFGELNEFPHLYTSGADIPEIKSRLTEMYREYLAERRAAYVPSGFFAGPGVKEEVIEL